MPEKLDFKKTLDPYRGRPGEFRVVDVPEMQFLQIDGQGDPNTSPNFVEAVKALYPVAYKLKFISKNDLGRDYVVPPLEGLWWADKMAAFTIQRDKSQWNWTMMLMVPEWLDRPLLALAVDRVATGRDRPVRLDDVRLERLPEGRCVQTLHIGPFDAEGPVLERLHHEFLPDNGLRMTGKHHEIYLSDFRRSAPAKQRTILRQPVLPHTATHP
jgi:hypothetical protein